MSLDIQWDVFPDYVRVWICELGWKESEITGWKGEREILPDGLEVGSDGQQWKRWKLGNHWTVTFWRGREKQVKTFDLKLAQIVQQIVIQHATSGQ